MCKSRVAQAAIHESVASSKRLRGTRFPDDECLQDHQKWLEEQSEELYYSKKYHRASALRSRGTILKSDSQLNFMASLQIVYSLNSLTDPRSKWWKGQWNYLILSKTKTCWHPTWYSFHTLSVWRFLYTWHIVSGVYFVHLGCHILTFILFGIRNGAPSDSAIC